MKHMLAGHNLAIAIPRSVEIGRGFEHVFCSRLLIQHHTVSLKEVNYLFPTYLHPNKAEERTKLYEKDFTEPNINPEFLQEMEKTLGLRKLDNGSGDLRTTFGPEDLVAYAYALLHSSGYRKRYNQFLRADFPRIPLTTSKDTFASLTGKGRELLLLHLLESLEVVRFITRYEQPGDHVVEKVSYVEPNSAAGIKSGRVYINSKQYFEGVPKEVWEFHIGGYQVCEKWLKDRKGRKLSSDDIDHYQKIVVALSETIRIMREIDELIPGWPLA